MDLKYPTSVQYDENKKFRSDRGFYSPEDLGKYQTLNTEFQQIDAEMQKMDKELLKRRFEVGLKYLEYLNLRDVQWKVVHKHLPNVENPKDEGDYLHYEDWRCVMGNIEANFSFSADTGQTSFFEGMRKAAEEIGDTEVVERMKEWPEERKVPYNNAHIHFSVGPKTVLPSKKDLWPGLSIHQRFGFKEEDDRIDVGFPLYHSGHAFPELSEEQKDKARVEIIKLTQKIGIGNI